MSDPSPAQPNERTLTMSSSLALSVRSTAIPSPVSIAPFLYAYVPTSSNMSSCSVSIFELPTAGAPSATEPLPM
jgi:hypothetical protein